MGVHNGTSGCPRQGPTSGVVKYTYARWFQPYIVHRRYCQLPVSGRNMKRFLQFRLGCHKLPIATGCRAGVVRPGLSGPRASRHCKIAVLVPWVMRGTWSMSVRLWLPCELHFKYADSFTATTITMHSFFSQSDHLKVFHYVIDCLNMMNA